MVGHSYLSDRQRSELLELSGETNQARADAFIKKYELMFADTLGQNGFATTFSSARMAFFALMKIFDLRPTDEVVLTGFTCSVMANAVMRIGATPVFVDISNTTFGTCPHALEKVITKKTKLVVAQHSFGIPCEIDKISTLLKKRGILLIEDCAISFDSTLYGRKLGTWGDAAIFSTDHSKPINTIIGGVAYTRNVELAKKLQQYARCLPDLLPEHNRAILNQINFEIKDTYPVRSISKLFVRSCSKLTRLFGCHRHNVFLDADSESVVMNGGYPYPSRMPAFLALLGIFELERWHKERERRRNILSKLIKLFVDSKYTVPSIFYDKTREIVPLRFIMCLPESPLIFENFIDQSWVWFRKPLVGSRCDIKEFNYKNLSCPISEEVCASIINIPCNIYLGFESKFINLIENVIRK